MVPSGRARAGAARVAAYRPRVSTTTTVPRPRRTRRPTRATLSREALALRSQGLLLREIAERLGVSINTVSAWLPRETAPRPDQLASDAWIAFLDSLTTREIDGEVRVNGRPLNESDKRALHRWRVDRARPSFFSADAFCVRVGLHINEFLLWAELAELNPWAAGTPPWFELDEEAGRTRSKRENLTRFS